MDIKQLSESALISRDIQAHEILKSCQMKQFLVVIEGTIEVIEANSTHVCQRGEILLMDLARSLSFQSQKGARFLTFSTDLFLADEEGLWGTKIVLESYDVYEMVPGHQTQDRWSAALLDIFDSPKHFHRVEKEYFFVVRGELHIEVDGVSQKLTAGEYISIKPGQVHKLTSAAQGAVRVLCLSFPAFSPQDMFLVEE